MEPMSRCVSRQLDDWTIGCVATVFNDVWRRPEKKKQNRSKVASYPTRDDRIFWHFQGRPFFLCAPQALGRLADGIYRLKGYSELNHAALSVSSVLGTEAMAMA